MLRARPAAAVAACAVVAAAGCASAHAHPPAVAPSSAPATSETPTTPAPAPSATPTLTAAAPAATTRPAPFRWSSGPVSAAQIGRSWHAGCPVAPAQLRAVSLTYWGFDNTSHVGTLVVNARVVGAIVGAFRRIYAARFPIRQIVPIAAYAGDDNKSMAADNTSAFNCRYAVANGPKTWSMHAYGEAVDINTLENPYTLDGRVYPPAGRPYTDRSDVRRGMIVRGSSPVTAFSAVGWGWGGNWSSSPDYQHFSANGR